MTTLKIYSLCPILMAARTCARSFKKWIMWDKSAIIYIVKVDLTQDTWYFNIVGKLCESFNWGWVYVGE